MIQPRRFYRCRFLRIAAASLFTLVATTSPLVAGNAVSYQRQIQPILSEHCYACHGPDRVGQENDLRLDIREHALESAIEPGDAAGSELIARLESPDPDQRMPPPTTKNPQLSARQINLLRRWIEEGAEYEKHWAHISPQKKEPPKKEEPVGDGDWPQGTIDRWVAAGHAQQGLKPAPPADRRTLIRRLSFDLTGLPPSVAEVEAFVADRSPQAYERVVDRLLASPHFGERMAIYWLDLVRYADTGGYHGDNQRDHTPYRDYVIRAFNQNLPYDQFVREQLAGDLLTDPSRQQQIASGFNRLNMTTREGGAQPQEYMAIYAADRVRNTSSIFLGLTLGCCQCHDHKFDPYTARDFYSMAAFFADIEETLVGIQEPLVLLDPMQTQRRYDLDQAASAAEKLLAGESELWDAAQAKWELSEQPTANLTWHLEDPLQANTAEGGSFERLDDGSLLATGARADKATYTFELPVPEAGVTAVQFELLPHESLPQQGPGRAANGNLVLSEVEIFQGERKLPIQEALATHSQKNWDIAAAIDGEAETGWAIRPRVGERLSAYFELAEPLAGSKDEPQQLTLRLQQLYGSGYLIGRLRVFTTAEEKPLEKIKPRLPYKAVYDALALPTENRSQKQQELLRQHFRKTAPETASVRQLIAAAKEEKKIINEEARKVLVSIATKPRVVRVLSRGNWQDETGEIVNPAVPASLGSLRLPPGQRGSRLDLAAWLIAKENPLTARVFVNRLWKLLFGRGLVSPLGDFGSQGSPPSHPELLDYLAVDFMEHAWDIKSLLRKLVLSGTYRQSSDTAAEMLERDPHNVWLARQGRFRLDAEMIRDNALVISGLLEREVGGESVRPYQPEGYLAHLNFPPRTYQHDEGENQYRRGLYTFWQRSFLHPAMALFDAPTREECTVERPQSNTPLQALLLLNDPSYVEAARVFASQILAEGGGDDAQRLQYAFRQALARKIDHEETRVLQRLLTKHRQHYRENVDEARAIQKTGLATVPEGLDPAELAAWTSVARTVLNLHETVTRN